ncbi:MAG: helix-turn-helix transcriptional regulator [Rhodocyclales bacterium]|nr:helix-turn-helix transcriptional regulator [Rhodocyclales bacterium]
MPETNDVHVRDICEAAAEVRTVAQFKDWIRHEVRHVLPHGALACGHGRVTSAGIAMDYVLTVDYPLEHLAALRNAAGGIETPIMRRWFETRSPLLFDAEQPWPDVSEEWLAHFRRHQLVNAAVHACYDEARCLGTYFSFHRLPQPLGQLQRAILNGITPLLHETLVHVIAQVEAGASDWPALSEDERLLAQQIAGGRSNADIAAALGICERTVGDRVAGILDKTGADNRAGLAEALLLREDCRRTKVM